MNRISKLKFENEEVYLQRQRNIKLRLVQVELGLDILSMVSGSSFADGKKVVGKEDPVKVVSQVRRRRLVIDESGGYFAPMT